METFSQLGSWLVGSTGRPNSTSTGNVNKRATCTGTSDFASNESGKIEDTATVECPSKPSEPGQNEAIDEESKPTAATTGIIGELGSPGVWGSYLSGVASHAKKGLSSTTKVFKAALHDNTILGDFSQEQSKFVESRGPQRHTETAIAPWVGYQEEDSMRSQILSLTKDERNLLRSPPPASEFHFNLSSVYPVATVMLSEDPRLSQLRFKLVPQRISEEQFWCNYFYRVSLVKQSSQLTTLASETGDTGEINPEGDRNSSSGEIKQITGEIKKGEIMKSVTAGDKQLSEDINRSVDGRDSAMGSPPRPASPTEFASDLYDTPAVDSVEEERKQLGMAAEDWETELQKELQEFEVVDEGGVEDTLGWEDELNEMLNNDDT